MRLIRYTSPRYTPSTRYPALRAEMDRLFDVAFPNLTPLHPSGLLGEWQGEFPVDLYQDKNAYTIRAELPGFRKEDISVELADGVLTVTGRQKIEQKTEAAENEGVPAAQERRVSRALSLPDSIDVTKIQAAYENGVLTVTLPKAEAIKPRQIAVDVK